MGYKNEESLSRILGITRQTLSRFGEIDGITDNTSNTLLMSILTLMEQFLYTNRYDYDNLKDYIQKFDQYFLGDLWNDENLRKRTQLMDPFFFEMDLQKTEFRYIDIWLKTFQYEISENEKEKDELIDYNKLTIRKIIDKYHIYVTSDFLLHDNAEEFFIQLVEIILKKNRKIKISNFTIDIIQNTRISKEYRLYQNGLKALEIVNYLNDANCLSRMKSNYNCKDEIELIINEILKNNINNVIVFSQENSYRILSAINNIHDLITKIITKECTSLSLNLTGREVNLNNGGGYKICSLMDFLKNN